MKKIFYAFFLFALSTTVFAASIIPPSYTVSFLPNKEEKLFFSVAGYYNISLEIGCPEWLVYNNDPRTHEGDRIGFTVNVNFPKDIKIPGEHRCGFTVKEYQDPNIPPSFSGIRAMTQVGGTIIVQVPYPERYAVLVLNLNNANKGDPIYASVYIKNFGIGTFFNIQPTITIYDAQNKTIATFLTTSAEKLETHGEATLWKKIDTNLYEAAKYRAVASYDYGGKEPATDEKFFFIGKPYVDILTTTENVTANKLNEYFIGVESWWGNPLLNVYAIVNVSNLTTSRVFQTLSIDLPPWTTGTLKGYFDASGLSNGTYNVEITAKYYNDQQTVKKTAVEIIEIPLAKEKKKLPIAFITVIVLIAIVTLINIILFVKKRKEVKK